MLTTIHCQAAGLQKLLPYLGLLALGLIIRTGYLLSPYAAKNDDIIEQPICVFTHPKYTDVQSSA